MSIRHKRILPVLAVVAACVWIAGIVVLGVMKGRRPVDDPEIRASVERSLVALQELRPPSARDAALARAVQELLERPHIATAWVLDPAGLFLLSEGATAASTPVGSTADELATDDARSLMKVLPESALAQEQATLLLAASAIRREGSHNDIYHHLLRPIPGPEGSTVAYLGIAYEHGGWSPGSVWVAGVLITLLGLVLYWISLPAWVLLDGAERGERAVAWAVFVLFGNFVALLAYLLVRAPIDSSQGDDDQ